MSIGLSKNDPDFLEIFCPSNHASNVSYLVLEQDLETGGWKYVRKIDNPDKKTKFNLPNGDALQINLRNLKNGSCSCVIYHIYFARGVGFYYINADLVE